MKMCHSSFWLSMAPARSELGRKAATEVGGRKPGIELVVEWGSIYLVKRNTRLAEMWHHGSRLLSCRSLRMLSKPRSAAYPAAAFKRRGCISKRSISCTWTFGRGPSPAQAGVVHLCTDFNKTSNGGEVNRTKIIAQGEIMCGVGTQWECRIGPGRCKNQDSAQGRFSSKDRFTGARLC
jgi:hypothetical protein